MFTLRKFNVPKTSVKYGCKNVSLTNCDGISLYIYFYTWLFLIVVRFLSYIYIWTMNVYEIIDIHCIDIYCIIDIHWHSFRRTKRPYQYLTHSVWTRTLKYIQPNNINPYLVTKLYHVYTLHMHTHYTYIHIIHTMHEIVKARNFTASQQVPIIYIFGSRGKAPRTLAPRWKAPGLKPKLT